jgi:glycosyltransferase involved in cell wall biosynthesis
MDKPAPPLVSVVLPVYHEDRNIAACLRGLAGALRELPHEILVCYDMEEDRTLPAMAAMPDLPPTVRKVLNTSGRGVAHALRSGFASARGDVVVVTMADLSDPPDLIPAMAERIRDGGAEVVSGSRYMKGGSHMGGPRVKAFLSRAAGVSLRLLAGLRTWDATNNFRAYRGDFLRSVQVESRHGFEVALELTVKAHLAGRRITELPSTWKDRTAGESRFRLWKWLPFYLRWYLRALAGPLLAWGLPAAALPFMGVPLLAAGGAAAGVLLGCRFFRGRNSAIDALGAFACFGTFRAFG